MFGLVCLLYANLFACPFFVCYDNNPFQNCYTYDAFLPLRPNQLNGPKLERDILMWVSTDDALAISDLAKTRQTFRPT